MQSTALTPPHLLRREIASTRAHMYASIGGAIGALSGELHGGANVQVMKMLLEIGDPANVDRWVANRLQSGGRIMGMGHAVYRTTDPRADILARLSARICREKNNKWYEITRRVEEATKKWMLENKHQGIYPNVDLYSASVYYSMGIAIDLNTPIFATSRIAGWSAHVIEEKFAEASTQACTLSSKGSLRRQVLRPDGMRVYAHFKQEQVRAESNWSHPWLTLLTIAPDQAEQLHSKIY